MYNTNRNILLLVFCFLILLSCNENKKPKVLENASIESLLINGHQITNGGKINDLPFDENIIIDIEFSVPVNLEGWDSEKIYVSNIIPDHLEIRAGYSNKNIIIIIDKTALKPFSLYRLSILSGEYFGVKISEYFNCTLLTCLDPAPKFPIIDDEELLTLVQQQTFKYFWDFGHPVSGMARERSSSGDIVTTGGTGFGIMAMIVAVERGFITRTQAIERLQTIVSFLDKQCTKYHGAFAHWVNGRTGVTQPFSAYDDGGDLVETALLMQGLLAARQYFNSADDAELRLNEDITKLWKAVDWTWYQKNSENVLYWHWSPKHEWRMNMKIIGWHEALIVYVLAASSPTHSIPKKVYDQGWAQNGNIKNGKSFYSHLLPLGPDFGGPLFFSHYSFLGLNPAKLKDTYADYWEQNRNHTLINYKYCVANPKRYIGYSENCWGLTACDGNNGYNAFSPTNDQGVIAPTAAISSMPYTPKESMQALKFFYYTFGDKLWKEYGFRDAFNLSEQWVASDYLAIDQGPIIVMLENFRSGLICNLFMNIEEIKTGLEKLGFSY